MVGSNSEKEKSISNYLVKFASKSKSLLAFEVSNYYHASLHTTQYFLYYFFIFPLYNYSMYQTITKEIPSLDICEKCHF